MKRRFVYSSCRVLRNVFAFALSLWLHATCQAAVVAWQFQGQFTEFGTDYAAAGLSVGDSLTGVVRFSTDAPDLEPGSDVLGVYEAILGSVNVPALNSVWTFVGPKQYAENFRPR
jgi:hypothetical protein